MKKIIIVSAVNFRSGGPLTILDDCLKFLDKQLSSEYKIIALVHSKKLLVKTNKIEFIEFPKSISSYVYRFYYEYYYFYKLSKKLRPNLWLSLHDMSPRIKSNIKAVYCHNPAPFYNTNLEEFFLDKKFSFFSLLYKYIYMINIKSNDYVIVQQNWMRERFKKLYNIKKCIVAYPVLNENNFNKNMQNENARTVFFYPSFPRVFKNFEIICEAIENINPKYNDTFEVILTIDGSENKYSKKIIEKYAKNKNIKFIGLQSRERVFELYSLSDCLIFPSKLETWGLPISEFKNFEKSMLLADLDYAHEAVGYYDKVKFFNPKDSKILCKYIENFIDKNISFDGNIIVKPAIPFSRNWNELFNILLEKKE